MNWQTLRWKHPNMTTKSIHSRNENGSANNLDIFSPLHDCNEQSDNADCSSQQTREKYKLVLELWIKTKHGPTTNMEPKS